MSQSTTSPTSQQPASQATQGQPLSQQQQEAEAPVNDISFEGDIVISGSTIGTHTQTITTDGTISQALADQLSAQANSFFGGGRNNYISFQGNQRIEGSTIANKEVVIDLHDGPGN